MTKPTLFSQHASTTSIKNIEKIQSVNATLTHQKYKIAVLGAGSWGASLANLLVESGHHVGLWECDPEAAHELETTRQLPRKLPGFQLNHEITVNADIGATTHESEMVVVAVPSVHMRSTITKLGEVTEAPPAVIVSATKGLEHHSLMRMSQVINQAYPGVPVAVLSGPSHAEEVSQRLPTSVVVAADNEATAHQVQEMCMTPYFRVYTGTDIIGVELGGSFKNIIAVAAGIAVGLGLGDNSLAALVTRGIAEITRLGTAMGAKPYTFAGLSGLGDLVVTCMSKHSRNRQLGERLGRGQSLQQAREEIGMVVEGAETARSIRALQNQYQIDLPLSNAVAQVLFEDLAPQEALEMLMLRSAKPEIEEELYI